MKKFIGLGVICLLLFTVSALANSGGPDSFGYTWKDNLEPDGPTFSFIDITSTGVRLGNGDDASFGPIDLGFNFPFFGVNYSQFNVNTNGLITMAQATPTRFNYCPVPDSGVADNWIAPFWDDLNLRPADTSGADTSRLYYRYFDSTVDYVVIQWHKFSIYGQYGDPMDMEAILYANGNILYLYNYINSLDYGQGQRATVGIEKDATDGMACLCNGLPVEMLLYSGKAIEFYAPIINHDIAVLSIDQPTYKLTIVGGAVVVRATLQNNGLMSDNFNAYLDILNSGGTPVFKDTLGMSLAPGATGLAIFSSWNIPVADSLTLVVTSGLSTDQVPQNNSMSSYVKSIGIVSLPISQDFEGTWPPVGWSVIDQSGDSSTWTGSTIDSRSPVTSAQACYDAYGAPDDWLVLPPINLAGASGVRWEYYENQSHWAANGLRHSLYVSTGTFFDPASATPLEIQTPANHQINGFAGDPQIVDLSYYAGNSHVWLAYRYEQNSGANWDSLDYVMEYWWIDDLSIYNIPLIDPGVHAIDAPTGFVRTRCESPVEVRVKNYGIRPATFDVQVTITGNSLGVVYDNTLTGISLQPGDEQALSFPRFTRVPTDSFTVTATTLLHDDNPANNTLSSNFYASTIVEHIQDDNDTLSDDCLVASPFNNSMLAVRYTPLDQDFTILGGNIFVPRYSEDPNGYAEYDWVKFCPDAGGVPDIQNAFATVEHVGTFLVPVIIPIDIPDVPVYNYFGDVWMVVKYPDSSLYFPCTGSDPENPLGNSFSNTQGNPPVWVADTDENYMMRLDIEYLPCAGAEPNIRLSHQSIVDTVEEHLSVVDTIFIGNLGAQTLQYGLHPNSPWITIVPDTGAVPTTLRDSIAITLSAAQSRARIPFGKYQYKQQRSRSAFAEYPNFSNGNDRTRSRYQNFSGIFQ